MTVNLVTIQGDTILQTKPPQQVGKQGLLLPGKYREHTMNIIVDTDLLSKHTLLIGGTGCGKTNLFYYYIQQIKAKMGKNDVMLIFDTKGDFFSKFYTSGDVVISNSKIYSKYVDKWNIYKEILVDGWDDDDVFNNAFEITHSLFKEAIEKTAQQFFPNAARDILSAILVAQIRLGKDDMEI